MTSDAMSIVLACNAGSGVGGAGVNTTAVSGGSVKSIVSINIPANSLSAVGSVLDITYAWSMTNSANAKTLALYLGGLQVGPTDSRTTSASATGRLRIRNAGASNSLVFDVLSADGAATSAFGSLTLDMTIDQQLSFKGACPTAGDTMVLTAYDVVLRKTPPAPATRAHIVPGKPTFYGINNHPGYYTTVGPARLVAIMKLLGMTLCRLDYYGTAQNAALQGYAKAFRDDGTGLQVYACIGAKMESAPGVAYASEAAAYAANFALGAAAATALAPYGVALYGCGNELDAASAGGVSVRTPNNTVQGTKAADFNASVWPLLRGAVNGCMDGVRSVQPKALCACNAFTNAAIYLSDALWNGTNLDGTGGFQQCRWDITDWHLYTEGNAASVDYSGSTGTIQFNLLAYLQQAYNRPIFISEFNPAIGGVTDSAATASATNAWLRYWYDNQAKYDIASVMFYDLFDSPYQIINDDRAPFTLNQTGLALKQFVAANPALR